MPQLRLAELADVTDYAVLVRYDLETWPSQEEARQAVALAGEMGAEILAVLPPQMHP